MRRSTRGKIIFWVILAILFALLYFQNRAFFEYRDRLVLDLFIIDFSTPTLPVAIFYLGFFFAGFIIAFFVGLVQRFRARKECQKLELRLEELTQTGSSEQKTGSAVSETEKPRQRRAEAVEDGPIYTGSEKDTEFKA